MSVRDFLYHPVSGKTNNYLLFFVSLLPAIILFSFPACVFSNGIDPPLAWVFNFLVHGKLLLGQHIIFPHGPLAFLMYPLAFGPNLWIGVSIHLGARIFLAYNLLKLATRKPMAYMILALMASFLLLAVNDLLLSLVQVVILCYLNFFERRNITWLIPALIIAPFALFVKAFVGIVCMLVTLSFAGIMIYRVIIGIESRYRLLLFLIVPFIFLLVWAGLYGNLHGMAAYLHGMLLLAADNSAAAAVYPLNNWWWIGIALLSGFLLIAFNIWNITLVRYTVLIGPAFFAIWKYGMAREDYLHTSMMFIFIVFVLLVYNIITGRFRIVNVLLSVAVVLFFYLTLQKSYYYEPFQIRVNGLPALLNKAFHYTYFTDTCEQSTAKSISRNKLDKSILNRIGDQSVDVYPWDYSYIAANGLNWQPRPVLQSYASYTRELDHLNAIHFESAKAPSYIIWELRKITHDIHGGTLESIDGRYLLNDEPETLLALMRQYEMVDMQPGTFPALILKHRAIPLKSEIKIIGQSHTRWNTWMDVPAADSGIIRASVGISRNMAGKLKSFFYKDEATYVYYLLDNGDIRMYRVVPKNMAYGLWINPLLINPESRAYGPAVKKIMFRCSNTAMMKDEIDVKWNKVSFSQASPSILNQSERINPIRTFFGITVRADTAEMLVSGNKMDGKEPFWSAADESKVGTNGSNRFNRLLPGEYSVSFQYPLDSLKGSDTSYGIIVRAGVWASALPGAKAVYVIAVENNNNSIIWKGVDIQDFIHEQRHLNFVTNYINPDKTLLRQKGLVLKVYAWNTGKEALDLDDFSVRIEKR